MATYNYTDGSITDHDKAADTLPNTGGPFMRSHIVDFSKQTLDSGNNDIAKVLNVPADTWVLQVFCRVITAETSNAEIAGIGYGSNYTYWYGVIVADTTGAKTTNYNPLYFSSADTIDIINNNNDVDFDALKIEVSALMIPCTDDSNNTAST